MSMTQPWLRPMRGIARRLITEPRKSGASKTILIPRHTPAVRESLHQAHTTSSREQTVIEHFKPPTDGYIGSWIGRAWIPGPRGGPAVIVIRPEGAFDITRHVATVSALCDVPDSAEYVRGITGEHIGTVEELLKALISRRSRRDRMRLRLFVRRLFDAG